MSGGGSLVCQRVSPKLGLLSPLLLRGMLVGAYRQLATHRSGQLVACSEHGGHSPWWPAGHASLPWGGFGGPPSGRRRCWERAWAAWHWQGLTEPAWCASVCTCLLVLTWWLTLVCSLHRHPVDLGEMETESAESSSESQTEALRTTS